MLQLFDQSKGLLLSGKTEFLLKRIMSDQIALCYSAEGKKGKLSSADDGILFKLVQALQCLFDNNPNAASKSQQHWVNQARE